MYFSLIARVSIRIHWENVKLTPPLRVANKHLSDTHVFHLFDSHFTSEGTATLEIAILWGDQSSIGEFARAILDVQRRWTNVHVALGRVTSFNVGDKAIKLRNGIRIALPVSAHDWLSARHSSADRGTIVFFQAKPRKKK